MESRILWCCIIWQLKHYFDVMHYSANTDLNKWLKLYCQLLNNCGPIVTISFIDSKFVLITYCYCYLFQFILKIVHPIITHQIITKWLHGVKSSLICPLINIISIRNYFKAWPMKTYTLHEQIARNKSTSPTRLQHQRIL